MRKIIPVLLSICLILSACANEESTQNINSTLTQFAQDITENNTENNNESSNNESAQINYENILIDEIGASYFEGRALMRADDEEIKGEICAVFQVGTSTSERFTTEEWLAVSQSLQVYKYDVALDEWLEFTTNSQSVTDVSYVSIQDCIYALNEVFKDEFSAEYYYSEETDKKAVYESEQAFNNFEPPVLLIGVNDEIPNGYFADPLDLIYMQVYNFNSKNEIREHFSLYFTQNFIANLDYSIEYNFFEFDGELYLVRGGMGYGTYSVDFDTTNYDNMIDNTMLVNTLYFGEPEGQNRVTFAEENGYLKIDSSYYLHMYDLINVNSYLADIQVPDFSSFLSGNYIPTDSSEFEFYKDIYSVKYLGEYYEYIPDYLNLFTLMGFTTIMDGYEGYYMVEKYDDNYTLTVNIYSLNDENGIVVEIYKQDAVG